VDIEHDDVEAAQRFYAGLFGWTYSHATPPDVPFSYVVAQLDGQDVAGIGGPREPTGSPGEPAWNTYIAVDDIDATAASVEQRGGRILDPPADAGEGGRAATCADPFGVRFCLWQARRRPGAQVTNAPGTWNFSDLHATDPAAAAAFYTDVFGWELADLGFATMITRPGYGDHLAATVDPGIRERQSDPSFPPGFADAIAWLAPSGDLGPGWHVTFAVADRDETAALVERLGGTVLSSEDTDWTRAALVADPQGGRFTASQFLPPDA
jgi:predicted enzyme related to lactoylglutathione lyase